MNFVAQVGQFQIDPERSSTNFNTIPIKSISRDLV